MRLYVSVLGILLFLIISACEEPSQQGWTPENLTVYTEKIYSQLLETNPNTPEKYVHVVAVNIANGLAKQYPYNSLDTLPNWYLIQLAQENNWYGWGRQDDVSIEKLDIDKVNFTNK